MGPGAAAKKLRSIEQALTQLKSGESLDVATRPDLPIEIPRLVAKRHPILFEMHGDIAHVQRIVHGAENLLSALDET